MAKEAKPFRLSDFTKRIEKSKVNKEYKFDKNTIQQITRLLIEYLAPDHFDKKARNRVASAHKQIKSLAKAFGKFKEKWKEATDNPYLQDNLSVHYGLSRHPKRGTDTIQRQYMLTGEKRTKILTLDLEDIKALDKAIEAVGNIRSFDESYRFDSWRTLGKGRRNTRQRLSTLVHELHEILFKEKHKQEDDGSRINATKSLLAIVGVKRREKTIRNILNIPPIKPIKTTRDIPDIRRIS